MIASWQELFIILVSGIFVLLLAGQWLAFALGLMGMALIYASKGMLGLESIGSVVWNTVDSYLLMAIALFLLMGQIILRSGISRNFYHGMGALISWLPGRLLHANIGACAVFAAVSGSSVACAATVGTVAIPELKALGYQQRLLFGSIAAGGTLGILLPPSIPMILYSALVQESVAKLFIAGVLPALVMASMFSLYIAIRCLIDPSLINTADLKVDATLARREKLSSVLHVFPVLALLTVVLGGIYTGVTTPTEAAALGVVGSLVLAGAYRALTIEKIYLSIMSSVRTTSMVMMIIIGAQILSAALTFTGVSHGASEWIYSLGLSKWEFFAVLVALYVILGCFIEGIGMFYLTLPVLYPVIVKFGFDLIWLGVVLVVLIEVGQIHPPLGLNLFTIKSIDRTAAYKDIALGSLPFVAIIMSMVLILCFFPRLALWLPSFL